jgi:hypothetical protein
MDTKEEQPKKEESNGLADDDKVPVSWISISAESFWTNPLVVDKK